jgi:hypothetical protein
MPALPSVAKVVRVDHHYTQGDTANLQIRVFLQYAGTLNTADATTWLTAIVGGMSTFMAAVSNTLSLTLSELTDLSSPTAPQVQNSTGATGSETTAENPAGTAMVLKYHILRRYRGGKPRVYIPGTLQSWLSTANVWGSSSLGVIVGDWGTYLNTATTTPGSTAIGAITHVNVSYYQGFVNHTYPSGRVKPIPQLRGTPIVDQIVNVSGNPQVASQRRRNHQSA